MGFDRQLLTSVVIVLLSGSYAHSHDLESFVRASFKKAYPLFN